MSAPRIAVVIPYFQRDAGLLQRALETVAAQEYSPFQVVVVDDGSPRTADEEITPQLREALPRLTVLRQPNRGVGAARNAALAALHPEVTAIALLDSDDLWEATRLRYAANALANGADFFFSNSRIEEHRAWRAGRRDCPRSSVPVARFRTPTVVFRRAVMPEARFPEDFRRAAEDQVVFWQLLTRSKSSAAERPVPLDPRQAAAARRPPIVLALNRGN
jgi:succinoglycan biosynthesis protein ExoW